MKINLHGIESPTVIFRKNTGIVYSNQCAGCACFQMEIEGFIFPFDVKKTDSAFFDKTTWKNSYGWNALNVNEFFLNPTKTYSGKEVLKIMTENSLNYRDIRTWSKFNMLCHEIEDIYTPLEITVNKDQPSFEAWIYIKSPLYGDGVLTWENSD